MIMPSSMSYGSIDPILAKIERRIQAEKNNGANGSGGGGRQERYTPPPKVISGSKFFGTNYYRDKLFEDGTKAIGFIRNDNKYVKNYANYLSESYEEALRSQLDVNGASAFGDVRTHMGFAFGGLRDSIKAKSRIHIEHRDKFSRVVIQYDVEPFYLQYGDYISGGRKAGGIHRDGNLIGWIHKKIELGSVVLKEDVQKDGVKERTLDSKVRGFAIAISRAAYKAPKPPVLKDWNNYYKNNGLRKSFDAIIKTKGTYLRTQIRKDLMKKLSIKYG